MTDQIHAECRPCLENQHMRPKKAATHYSGTCTRCNKLSPVYDVRDTEYIGPAKKVDGGMVTACAMIFAAVLSFIGLIVFCAGCSSTDRARIDREIDRAKAAIEAEIAPDAPLPPPAADEPTQPDPEPPADVPPTGGDVSATYPWSGLTVINATERSRHSDGVRTALETYQLAWAQIRGGRCEYGPRFTTGWPNRGHMTSRAVLVWRKGSSWYSSDFAGWADMDGHDYKDGSWCAVNEFTTWASGSDPMQSDELWFAVAPKEGGKRSSYRRIK